MNEIGYRSLNHTTADPGASQLTGFVCGQRVASAPLSSDRRARSRGIPHSVAARGALLPFAAAGRPGALPGRPGALPGLEQAALYPEPTRPWLKVATLREGRIDPPGAVWPAIETGAESAHAPGSGLAE